MTDEAQVRPAAQVIRIRGVGPAVRAHPVLGPLVHWWRWGYVAPTSGNVRTATAALDLLEPRAAYVVCLGDIRPPEVGDSRFEPEILTTTRLLSGRLRGMALALGGMAVWAGLQIAGVLPSPGPFGGLFPWIIGSSLIVWLWRVGIRARYVRLAPGMIQVLRYRWPWTAVPSVRSYPMTAGTLVVITERDPGYELALARDKHQDRVSLRDLRTDDPVVERLWHALLSTAPTPPLSETGLVG